MEVPTTLSTRPRRTLRQVGGRVELVRFVALGNDPAAGTTMTSSVSFAESPAGTRTTDFSARDPPSSRAETDVHEGTICP